LNHQEKKEKQNKKPKQKPYHLKKLLKIKMKQQISFKKYFEVT